MSRLSRRSKKRTGLFTSGNKYIADSTDEAVDDVVDGVAKLASW